MRTLLSLCFLLLLAPAADARGCRNCVHLGYKTREELIEILKTHADARYRSKAASTLGEDAYAGDAESREALVAAYQGDAVESVRIGAASAIMSRKEKQTFDLMLSGLADVRTDRDVRWQLAHGIHRYGDRRAAAVLLEVLKDPALEGGAMTSLGELKVKEAIEPISRILWTHLNHHDNDHKGMSEDWLHHNSIMIDCARALGAIGDPEGLRHVLPLFMHTDNWYRRQVAVEAVADMGASPSMPQGTRDGFIVPFLIGRLDQTEEPNGTVRWHTVMALERFGGSDAVVAALQRAHADDEDYQVRLEAAKALAKLGKPCKSADGHDTVCDPYKPFHDAQDKVFKTFKAHGQFD